MFRYNPVLHRELIVNLRQPRSFWLLLIYQVGLAALVLSAYPRVDHIDITESSTDARRLADFFFLGQFAIVSLMAPSFAAGAIAGEKERKTYEMLLASPLRPMSIVVGKLIASLAHLLLLMVGSLPIIFICLPLGGISMEEVVAAYLSIVFALVLFGSISIAASSYFKRASSSLVVSYMIIAPMVIVGILAWVLTANSGASRILITTVVLPIVAIAVSANLLLFTSRRLLYPQDIGSMGEEVIDIEKEQENAVGMIIQRDRFPDRLFAPPRRAELIADGANPVYDKELHAELFSQGTLMLRIVIQVSMYLAIPLMAWLLFVSPERFRIYMDYVLVFNALVTSVFAAGCITSERERQTIDLLLTSPLSAWQILSGKLIVGFRVAYVLTIFLLWPVVLATVLNPELRQNVVVILLCTAIITCAAVVNLIVAAVFSVLLRRTRHAMVATFCFVLLIYLAPVVIHAVMATSPNLDSSLIRFTKLAGIASPFMAMENVPIFYQMETDLRDANQGRSIAFVYNYVLASIAIAASGIVIIFTAFRDRSKLTGRN